jgi:hypothetical protein
VTQLNLRAYFHREKNMTEKNVAAVAALGFLLATSMAQAVDDTSGDVGGVLAEETRVYIGPCFFAATAKPAAQKSFAFGAILGMALKETVVDFAVGALKAAGEDKSMQAIAAYPANGWMYELDTSARVRINPETQCVQLVSGSFWNGVTVMDKEAVGAAPTRDTTKVVPIDQRELEILKDANGNEVRVARWKSDKPLFGQLKARFRQLKWTRFFFEARLEALPGSDDKLVLAPNALYLEKPVDKSFFDFGTAKRNILVTVSLATAGAELGKSFGSVNFPFRDVPNGTMLTPLYFRDHTSRAIQVPELDEDEKKLVLGKKAKLDGADGDVTLTEGPPAPPEYVSPDSFENKEFVAAAIAYCSALKAFNTQASKENKKAAPLTANECPVELQIAKLSLSKARVTFDEGVAKAKAAFNTRTWKLKPDDASNAGVTCAPKDSGLPSFESECLLTKASNLRPITVSASVVEVREGSKFAAFLGKVLEKAQPGINAAIAKSAPEAKKEASEQSKQNLEAYQLALGDVEIADAKLAEVIAKADATASEKSQAQHELLNKKIAANQAARKAGVSEPYAIP